MKLVAVYCFSVERVNNCFRDNSEPDWTRIIYICVYLFIFSRLGSDILSPVIYSYNAVYFGKMQR
jgi:hypothetical protein